MHRHRARALALCLLATAAHAQSPAPDPLTATLEALATGNPESRRDAAQSLLNQLAAARTAFDASEEAAPEFRSRFSERLFDLRRKALDAIDPAQPAPESLPLLLWYIHTEDPFDAEAFTLLLKIHTPDADRALLDLLNAPSQRRWMLIDTLEEAALRKLPLDRPRLIALCQDHHPSLRAAARRLAAALAINDIPPFDETAALASPPVRKITDALPALLPMLPATDAPFMLVTEWKNTNGKITPAAQIRGWALRNTPTTLTLITPFGRRKTLDGRADNNTPPDAATPYTWRPLAIQDEVARIQSLADKHPESEFTAHHFDTLGTFEEDYYPRDPGLNIAMLTQWLLEAHQPALAAKLLLPLLDQCKDDHDFLDNTAEEAAALYAHHMLNVLAGTRDYAAALADAKTIQNFYPDTRFSAIAKELALELPARDRDFITLTLPTPDAWKDLKPTLTRAQRIDYLCERLRLINTIRHNNPGDVDPSDPQHLEPLGLSENGRILDNALTPVINPYVELLAEQLAIDDVPALTAHLKPNWYTLGLRLNNGMRTPYDLLTTRQILSWHILGLVGARIFDPMAMDKMTPKELDACIDAINRFARKNKGKSHDDLRLQWLADGAENGKSWWNVMLAARDLAETGDRRILPHLYKFLGRDTLDDGDTREICDILEKLDPDHFHAAAADYLRAPNPALRRCAALELLDTGDHQSTAIQILGDGLAADEGSPFTSFRFADDLQRLLDKNTPAARTAARRALNPAQPPRLAAAKAFTDAHLPDGLTYLLAFTNLPDHRFAGKFYNPTAGDVFARIILWRYDPNDPDLARMREPLAAHPDQAKRALQHWLTEKAAALSSR